MRFFVKKNSMGAVTHEMTVETLIRREKTAVKLDRGVVRIWITKELAENFEFSQDSTTAPAVDVVESMSNLEEIAIGAKVGLQVVFQHLDDQGFQDPVEKQMNCVLVTIGGPCEVSESEVFPATNKQYRATVNSKQLIPVDPSKPYVFIVGAATRPPLDFETVEEALTLCSGGWEEVDAF